MCTIRRLVLKTERERKNNNWKICFTHTNNGSVYMKICKKGDFEERDFTRLEDIRECASTLYLGLTNPFPLV